jgi:hypothetical protein
VSAPGESNLKLRSSPKETTALATVDALCAHQFDLRCEAPNNALYSFDGTLAVSHLGSLRTDRVSCTSVSECGQSIATKKTANM